jgi:hypothetical protein
LILGPALEENMRRALLVSRGNANIFLTSPISLAMLLLAVAFIVVFARLKKITKTPVESTPRYGRKQTRQCRSGLPSKQTSSEPIGASHLCQHAMWCDVLEGRQLEAALLVFELMVLSGWMRRRT